MYISGLNMFLWLSCSWRDKAYNGSWRKKRAIVVKCHKGFVDNFIPSWTNSGLFPSWTVISFVSSWTAQRKEHVQTWFAHFKHSFSFTQNSFSSNLPLKTFLSLDPQTADDQWSLFSSTSRTFGWTKNKSGCSKPMAQCIKTFPMDNRYIYRLCSYPLLLFFSCQFLWAVRTGSNSQYLLGGFLGSEQLASSRSWLSLCKI